MQNRAAEAARRSPADARAGHSRGRSRRTHRAPQSRRAPHWSGALRRTSVRGPARTARTGCLATRLEGESQSRQYPRSRRRMKAKKTSPQGRKGRKEFAGGMRGFSATLGASAVNELNSILVSEVRRADLFARQGLAVPGQGDTAFLEAVQTL